jgi:hypothetical protein
MARYSEIVVTWSLKYSLFDGYDVTTQRPFPRSPWFWTMYLSDQVAFSKRIRASDNEDTPFFSNAIFASFFIMTIYSLISPWRPS